MKIHSSCEFEDFVETHLCKLCVILRSRAFIYMNCRLAASCCSGQLSVSEGSIAYVVKVTASWSICTSV